MQSIKNSLKELGFKENEIKVYLAVTQLGEAPASKIAKKTDLPRTTVISILDKLKNEQYLSTHKYKGVTQYWIESPKTLKQSFENKISIAEDLNKMMTDMYRSERDFPFADIYDTKKGIKQFIEKALISLPKGTKIYTIDHPGSGNYNKIYSDEFSEVVLGIKRKKNIKTYTLVPHQTFKNIRPYKLAKQNITIREMPKGIDFCSAIWIMGDHLIHFSGQSPFIASINHKIIAKSMKSIYDFLWNISELKNNDEVQTKS